jgi:hypothetical protein
MGAVTVSVMPLVATTAAGALAAVAVLGGCAACCSVFDGLLHETNSIAPAIGEKNRRVACELIDMAILNVQSGCPRKHLQRLHHDGDNRQSRRML